jgi:Uma2 family endonuclease
MSLPTYQDIQRIAYQGVRLEITGGRTTWEAMPGALHNGVVDDIRQSLTRHNPPTAACGCHHIADTYIEFAPSLLRRPDIAVFCAKPPRPDGAITNLIPGAVIEVLSVGYEQKDRDAVTLYLSAGVLDVLLIDPRRRSVEWHRQGEAARHLELPATCALQMGCTLPIDRT